MSEYRFQLHERRNLSTWKIKVKFSLQQFTKAQGNCRCITQLLLSFTSALDTGGNFNVTPWPSYPRWWPRIPCIGGMVGCQRWSGRELKISPPSCFDPRPILPVDSRHTDWDIPEHEKYLLNIKKFISYIYFCYKDQSVSIVRKTVIMYPEIYSNRQPSCTVRARSSL